MAKIKFYFLWLSLICIISFIMQNLIPRFTEFFILNNRALYLKEYWRFLSAIFLHGDIIHLFYNLFALLLFGFSLEKLIGSRRFLIVFLLSGILANLIAVNFYESSLGASGAIYGVMGSLTIISPFMIVWAFSLPMPIFIASILWIIGDLIGIITPSNIGNIAHLSGIAIGFVFGFLFRILKKSKNNFKKERFIFPESYMRSWENSYMG